MNEITLRNGEVAILTDGTIIMNDDTLIGLMNKLDALDNAADKFNDYDDELPSQEDIDAYFAAQHDIDEKRESSEEYDEDDEIEVDLDDCDDEIEFIIEDLDDEDELTEYLDKKDIAYLDTLEKVLTAGIEIVKHFTELQESENTNK